jgi:hypothetical protein
VITLGLVSLFTDFSSEMIYPLLPVFLTTVLGAGAASLGVIEGVAETTAALDIDIYLWTPLAMYQSCVAESALTLEVLCTMIFAVVSNGARFFDRTPIGRISSSGWRRSCQCGLGVGPNAVNL